MAIEPAKRRGARNIVPLTGRPEPIDVLNVDEELAMELHHRMQQLEFSVRDARFGEAEVLWQIWKSQAFRRIGGGYDSVQEYARDQFDFSERTTQYLISCWDWYGVTHVDCPDMLRRAREVGWSLAKELIGHVTPENYNEWFDKAQECGRTVLLAARRVAMRELEGKRGVKQLPSHAGQVAPSAVPSETPLQVVADVEPETVRAATIEPQRETEPLLRVPEQQKLDEEMRRTKEWHTRTYHFHQDAIPTLDEAIRIAREQSDGRAKDDAYCLDMICVAFTASAAADGVEIRREDLLRGVERATGLTLVAIDETTGEIAYGEESAARISRTE